MALFAGARFSGQSVARIQALRLSSVFALVLVAGLAPRLARADEARASGPTGDAPKADGSSASARPTRPPLTASLAWARAEGAEECIAAPTLAKEIEARLKREVFVSPATAEVTVEGSVAPLAAPQRGYRASFRVLDRTGAVLGSRQVETHEASCRTLDERAILIASILIDDAEHVRAAEGPPAPVGPLDAAADLGPGEATGRGAARAAPRRRARTRSWS